MRKDDRRLYFAEPQLNEPRVLASNTLGCIRDAPFRCQPCQCREEIKCSEGRLPSHCLLRAGDPGGVCIRVGHLRVPDVARIVLNGVRDGESSGKEGRSEGGELHGE